MKTKTQIMPSWAFLNPDFFSNPGY